MRDRDLFLLGIVGIGAYALYKNETKKISSVVDSIAVPLTFTSNTINSANQAFTSTYTGITKEMQDRFYKIPAPLSVWDGILHIMPIPNTWKLLIKQM